MRENAVSDRNHQVLGHYQLLRRLGQGGFADVYLGQHIHLNTYAAIKILRTQVAEDDVQYFRTEARTLASLKHPHIVQVLDFGVDEMTPYLVMQYAPHGTLRQYHPRGVPVPLAIVISFVQQIASALQYAHNQKLIHRDIKPENMLIGEQYRLLLSDFGIAILSASARASAPTPATSWQLAGTASYMAPEQIQGHPVAASDQYALAVVIYEWLTGELPFQGSYMEILSQHMTTPPPPLRSKVSSIAEGVEQVLFTALQKDARRRFGHIQDFAQALQQAAQGVEWASTTDASSKSAVIPPDSSMVRSEPGQPPVNPSLPPVSHSAYGVQQNNLEMPPSQHSASIPPGQIYTDPHSSNLVPSAETPMPHSATPGPQQPAYTPVFSTNQRWQPLPPPAPVSPGYIPQGVSYTPVQPRQKRSSLRMVVLAAVALVIILLGAVGTVAYRNQVDQRNENATATAQTQQRLLTQQHGTATALTQQHATATAVEQQYATATALVTSPYPPFTKLAFIDSLTHATTWWPNGAGCAISSTGLVVSIASVHRAYNCYRSGEFGEMAYQVTMTITHGDCGGLVFRYVDLQNFNDLYVCQDGTYNIGGYIAGNAYTLYPQHKATSAIHQGTNQQNIIAVTLQATTIVIYINGQPVDETQEAALTSNLSQGKVGLLAADFGVGTSVRYTNAIVWTM
jgi:serine/threonine protein kinase/type II secretory pathway pseudopilin PulG